MLAIVLSETESGNGRQFLNEELARLCADTSKIVFKSSEDVLTGEVDADCVLALSRSVAETLVHKRGTIKSLRGVHDGIDVPIVVTYGPDAILKTKKIESPYYQPFREEIQKALDISDALLDMASDEIDFFDAIKIAKQDFPENTQGWDVSETLDQLAANKEKYDHEEAGYVQPTDNALEACGGCRFFLRDETQDLGRCQVVDGSIAWFGSCALYISASLEAVATFEAANEPDDPNQEISQSKQGETEDEGELTDHRHSRPMAKVSPRSDETKDEFISRCMVDLSDEFPDQDQRFAACSSMYDQDVSKVDVEKRQFMSAILKADEHPDFTFVLTPILVPESTDNQGDIIDEEVIQQAAHDYMEKSQVPGFMHRQMLGRSDAVMVESFITRLPMTFNGKRVKKGTWIGAWRVYNPQLRGMIRTGKLGGVSIGGKAMTGPVKT